MRFIRKHEAEIAPLLNVGQDLSKGNTDRILETYETKVFVYKSPEERPDAQRVLLEASQPANYAIVKSLLQALVNDARCSGATLLTDNVAGKRFDTDASLRLQRKQNDHFVMADVPPGPYVSALAIDEPVNSATPFVLESAKSAFEAGRVYFWSLQLFDPRWKDSLGNADAILTTNDFTAALTRAVIGDPQKEIVQVGSPLIDAIDQDKEPLLRTEGRRTLGIPETATVVFHSSIVPGTFAMWGESPALNDTTFLQTIEGTIRAAQGNPDKEFVLLIRIHPRMKNVYQFPPAGDLPRNVRIVDGDSASYDEVVYASDVLCCNPLSTEVILAPYRGRRAIVLAYSGKGQLGEIIEGMYGKEAKAFLENNAHAAYVDSPNALSRIIASSFGKIAPIPGPGRSSTDTVKEILLMGSTPVQSHR